MTVRATERGQRRGFHALLASLGVSGLGNEMAAVAIPWFALVLTGDDYAVGVVATASLLPLLIAATLGGVLVDRFGFRTMSVASDIASGVTVAMIPLLHVTVGISLPMLALLAFLGILLDAPGVTARQALLPDLAAASNTPMERALAMVESVLQVKNLVGPLAAGVLITVLSAPAVLWIDAATFGLSAILVGLTVQRVRSRHAGREDDPTAARHPAISWRADLLTGFRTLKRDTFLLTLSVFSLLVNMLIAPAFLILAPLYAQQEMRGATQLGIMLAAFGGFALVGAMLYGSLGHRVPRRTWYLGSFASGVAGFIVLALQFGFLGGFLAFALLGIMSGTGRPLRNMLRYERTPREVRGRVFGVLETLTNAATPVGTLLAGACIPLFGLSVTLWCVAAFAVVLQLALWSLLPLRGNAFEPPEGDLPMARSR